MILMGLMYRQICRSLINLNSQRCETTYVKRICFQDAHLGPLLLGQDTLRRIFAQLGVDDYN